MRNKHHMNIPRSISQPRKTISLSHTQSRNALIVTKRGQNMLALIVIANSYNKARSKYKHFMGILRSTSHQRKTSSLLHQWKRANSYSQEP